MNLIKAARATVGAARIFVIRNQAPISLFFGLGLMIGGTLVACRKTLNVEPIIDGHLQELNDIHTEENTVAPVDGQHRNELAKRKARLFLTTGIRLVSNFGIPVLMILSGSGFIVNGYRIINKKFVIANGLFLSERRINEELRQRIRERDGDGALQEIEHGTYTGSSDSEKPGDLIRRDPITGPFTVTIDESNPHWMFEDINETIPSLQLTMQHIYDIIEGWNDKLHGFGSPHEKIRIFWNDLLRDLKAKSKPFVRAGYVYGVLYDPDDMNSDQYLDVGCYPRKLDNGHYEIDMVFRNMRNIIDDPAVPEF